MRKQKFLEEIMERTELLKDELRRGEGILEEDSTWQLPVLSLWRLLLSSKYKQHVRRGFRDFDLESLMSILYLKLVRPSNPPSNVKDEQELAVSLYQSNSEFTDIKHLQLMCWDEDEKPFDEEKREGNASVTKILSFVSRIMHKGLFLFENSSVHLPTYDRQ